MEEKNQNIEKKKELTQEEIEDVQGGSPKYSADHMEWPPMQENKSF